MMTIEFDTTYRVVTPMFCSGADPNRAELRLTSFKGVLRFWWRALAWSRYQGDLGIIKRKENDLFGSTDSGQSRVMIRLKSPSDTSEAKKDEVLTVAQSDNRVVGEGARYLGYGVLEAYPSSKKQTKAGQLTRACFYAPFNFTVSCRLRDFHEDDLRMLKDALVALGHLGGMGAKSRKGYGSMVSWFDEEHDSPATIETLIDTIRSLYHGDVPCDFPEYTAFSQKTRHVLLSAQVEEPIDLLDLVGREIVRYRSWGRNGVILGGNIESERRFKDDHDLMKSGRRSTHPRRIAFGLPHNYSKKGEDQVGPHDSALDRRASPLFIHIHECDTGPVAVVSFLPARFLPMGKPSVSVGGTKVIQTPEQELYAPIHDFLDRLLDDKKRQEPFTTAVEVLPQ